MTLLFGYIALCATMYAALARTAMQIGVPTGAVDAPVGEIIYLPIVAEDERRAA